MRAVAGNLPAKWTAWLPILALLVLVSCEVAPENGEAEPPEKAPAPAEPEAAPKPAQPGEEAKAPQEEPQEQPAEPPAAQPEPPQPRPGEEAKAPAPQEAQESKYDKILQKYLERVELQEQQVRVESRKWLDLAKAYKARGDLEKARDAVQRALEIWPMNFEARALKKEIDEILGQGPEPEPSNVVDRIKAQWKGQIVEALNHIRTGERFLQSREYEKALREFEEAEVRIMAMPDQLPEKGSFLPLVRDYQRKIKDAMAEEEKAKIRIDRERAEYEQRIRAEAEKKEIVRRIAQLLEMAYMTFDQRRYEACERLCDKILWIDPNYIVAKELREDARKAQVRKAYRDMVTRKILGWKAMTRSDHEARIPYQDAVTFPSHEKWVEIEKRAERSVLKSIEDVEQPEPVVAMKNKMGSMKVNLAFDRAPLRDVLAYLREASGINIIVAPEIRGEIDLDTPVTFNVDGVDLDVALKYILKQVGDYAYRVTEEKIVMITTSDRALGEPITQLYDIRDLTARYTQFPGPSLEFKPPEDEGVSPGVSFAIEAPEAPKVSRDSIVTMIRENIYPDLWTKSDLYLLNLTPNGMLLVKAPAPVHRSIRTFLGKMRSYSGVMVNVVVRFLAAYDDFLQDVGWNIPPPTAAAPAPAGLDLEDPAGVVNGNMIPWPWIPGFLEGATITGQVFHTLINADPAFASAGIAMTFDPISGRMRNQGGLGLSYTWDGAITGVLRMVDKHEKATIVQAPRVTAFNGQRAHILSVTRMAYIRDIDAGAVGFAGGLDLVIGYLNHGVVLDVRPVVSHDRKYVTLEVRADFAELVLMRPMDLANASLVPIGGQPQLPPQPGGPPQPNPTGVPPLWVQLPFIVYQRVNTTALVPDRGTMIIGGFRDIQMQDAYSGMPFVENIPIVDFFFSRKGKREEKRRLFILITPEIVDVAEKERLKFD